MSAPKEEAEPVWTLLLLCVVLAIVGYIFWSHFRPQILTGMRYVRLGELSLIGLFTHRNDACIEWLRIVPYGNVQPPPQVIGAAQDCFGAAALNQLPPDQSINFYTLTGPGIAATGRRVARYTHFVFAGIFVLIGVYIFFFSPRNRFKKHHNLESFIKTQAKMWPVIAPIVNFKPSKYSARAPGQPVPDRLPPFAEALSPEEWLAFHRIAVTNGVPEREAVRRAFLLQLGPRWNGIDGTPPHVQALFAAFALKGAQKREDSDNLLGRISLCWDVKKGFVMESTLMDEIKRVNKDGKTGAPALAIAEKHAYRATALLGTLKWARSQGGVLAPAQFLWLRGADRALWYPLNNLGRRSFHTEGAGAMAHFMAEQSAKKPLPIPRIDTAIVTLNQYLATSGQPIPPREEPGKKGRGGNA